MMFDVKTEAEVRQLGVRKQVNGDGFVPADDIRLMLLAVPVDKITSACPEMKVRFYDKNGQVAVGEINPLTVQHKLEGVRATIGDVELTGADIKKGMKITLLPDYVANVELTLQVAELSGKAHSALRSCYVWGEVDVEILEQQIKIEDMEA